MTLLVTGADRVDAGKTTFSVGLVEYTDAVGFKPRAGNDHWFHHDDFRHAVEQGRLFGKDARRLADASPGDHAPEDINPVHRFWRPSPGHETGLLGQADREFVVDRVAQNYVVNETVEIPPAARENLPLEDAISVDSLAELNDVMEHLHLPALTGITRRIDQHERSVVESYSDIALPLQNYDPDAVAVVEPRRVRIYSGERFTEACSVVNSGPTDGQLETRVPAVLPHVDPTATRALPPLSSGERSDPATVADAYSHAYDAMLEARF